MSWRIFVPSVLVNLFIAKSLSKYTHLVHEFKE